MLHMILGGAGTGKSTALGTQIRDAAASGKTVYTLVPEQFAFTYDNRLYSMLGAALFNQIRTGSFRSLTAEILSEIAADPRDAADDVVKTVVLHRILGRLSSANALRYYGRQAERPAFLPEMQAQLTELMQSGSTPEQLADVSAATEGVLSDKVFDIARIYAEYLDELKAHGLRDTLCDLTTAAAAAEGTGYLRGCVVFLDEFESFTGDEYAMLEVLLRDAEEVWIALRTEDPDQPDFSRFDAVNDTARRLRRMAAELAVPADSTLCKTQYRYAAPSLAHLSRHLYTGALPAYEDASAVTITEARDMSLEAEYCAAQIRRLLMEGEVQSGEIMVVMHDLASYGAMLEAAFERYEIPCFMDLRRSVLHTAVMKLPLSLLALAKRIRTEDLLVLLKTQLSPLHPQEAAALENYAYTWDIEGEQWEKPFAEETDPNGFCEKIRQKLIPPLITLQMHAAKAQTGADLCGALYRCIEEMGIPMRVGGLAEHMKDQGDVTGARALRRLWNRFTELLDAMHEALEQTPVTAPQLADLLTAVLRANQIPVPPQTLDAVTVQSAAAARYDKPKVIFVLGVNEGQFPAEIAETGFFSENERLALSAQGIDLSRSVRDLCADERLIVYKTLSAPSHRLYLCYALADESGKQLLPSALLEDVRTLLPKTVSQQADRLGTEFYVTTVSAAYYSFVQDYTVTPTERETVRAMLSAIPSEKSRLERLRRQSDPGALRVTDRGLMQKLTGRELRMSATHIENAVKCPFMGFCANGLRLYVREKKNLNPLSVGNLVHSCMERLFKEHTRDEFLAMTDADLRAHAERTAEIFLREQLGGAAGRPPRFLMNYRRATNRMLRLLQHTQAELRQSEFKPDACELVIGKVEGETGTAPYTLTLSNGVTLYLRGKIDRVDTCEQDGKLYLRIVDYKTGQKQFDLADIYYGLNLQMLLYLFALLDDNAYYPDAEPAGVLYMPAGAPGYDHSRSDPDSLADHINNYFRMHGTVLCDRGILTKMEQTLAGVYIPASLAKGADPDAAELSLSKDSSVFTPRQLKNLRRYAEGLVAACAESYLAGEVAPHPMKKLETGKKFYDNTCDYCKYHGLCGIEPDDTAHMHLPMKQAEAEAEMRRIMDGEPQENDTESEVTEHAAVD